MPDTNNQTEDIVPIPNTEEIADDDVFADDPIDEETPEDVESSLADFFGVSLDDQPSDDTPDDTDANVTDDTAKDEKPATPPAESETPTPQAQAQPAQDNDAGPLNEYGLPDISPEEWKEYLDDNDIPLSERLENYNNYHAVLNERKIQRHQQLQETRQQEVNSVREKMASRFGDVADEINKEVEERVAQILSHLPESQRLSPGFHALAHNLVVAENLDAYMERAGFKQGAKKNVPQQPAAKPQGNAPQTRVVQVENSNVPRTPSQSTTEKALAQLTREERQACKEFGIDPTEYLKNK